MERVVNTEADKSAAPAIAAVLAAGALWGTTGTAQALGPDTSSALGVGAIRLVIGGFVLALIAVATGHGRREPWAPARARLLVGGIWVAVYQLAFFEATRRAGVAPATLVTIASAPAFSHLLAFRRSGVRPSRSEALPLGLIALGVMALGAAGGSSEASSPVVGILCALLAGFGYASYAQCGREAIDTGMHSTTAMAGLFCVGGLAACVTLPWQPLSWVATASGLTMLAHLGIVTLGAGYVLYGWGLGRLPVPTVVTLSLAEPAVAAVLAVVVLDEVLRPLGWVGVTLIAAGLAVTAHHAARRADPSAPPDPAGGGPADRRRVPSSS